MSYADDMGYDAYDPPEPSNSKVYEWENTHGEIDLITNLDTTHLINIWRGNTKGKDFNGQAYKRGHIEKELIKRGEM